MKTFFKVVLGCLVALFVFVIFWIFLFSALVAGSEDTITVADNSVLYLKLDGPLKERVPDMPFDPSDIFGGPTPIGLVDMVEAIDHAREDDNIKGIYIEPGIFTAGYGHLKEIRDALIEFKESGKFVLAYSEFFTESSYYLCSAADEVYIMPEGFFELNGLSSEVTFIKGTLEKLNVEPEIFRVGEYKGAVETFLRKDLSQENREQIESYLNSIYDTYLEEVSASRGIETSRLRTISDSMLVRKNQDAVDMKLLTGLAYSSEVQNMLKEKTGIEADDELELIEHDDYRSSFRTDGDFSTRIAVIVADGDIVSGESSDGMVGSFTIAEELRKARENDRVKAVVIRINSPGGSALASDVMWNEVRLTAAEKPVIASMSNVAASGGYYLAMAADTIMAQPNTVTGSIGIFLLRFNAQGLLNEHLGVTTDVVNTGRYSDILTMSRPLSEQEREIIQKQVNEGYQTFISKAAEGRNMNLSQMKELAAGRVWSGSEALERGLIDKLGGLQDAISVAASSAGLEDGDYSVRYYPEEKDFFTKLAEGFNSKTEERIARQQLGEYYQYLKLMKKLNSYQGMQARMPFEMQVK
ncbi:signal peptide peptidase SppA [Roseivirga sp. BDSF3-8]|uniref:signal peptide peptidase SppA n=1 Tax=Roseivirga sp. BDSF3-8 TaxID=3241598 RepID=UPI003531E980